MHAQKAPFFDNYSNFDRITSLKILFDGINLCGVVTKHVNNGTLWAENGHIMGRKWAHNGSTMGKQWAHNG